MTILELMSSDYNNTPITSTQNVGGRSVWFLRCVQIFIATNRSKVQMGCSEL